MYTFATPVQYDFRSVIIHDMSRMQAHASSSQAASLRLEERRVVLSKPGC